MIFHLIACWLCSVAHCLATKIIVRVQVDLVEKAWFCCYWQAHPWIPKLLWQKVIDTNILGRCWPRTHINLISSWICGPTPHLSPLSKCKHLQCSTPLWRSSSTPGFTLHWVLYSKSPEHFPQTQQTMQQLHQVILHCITRALLILIRSWVALSFKVVSEWVSQWGISNTCPNLHFLQYIKAWMSSTDPVSSIINCYRLIVSYTDPVHSFIIS